MEGRATSYKDNEDDTATTLAESWNWSAFRQQTT